MELKYKINVYIDEFKADPLFLRIHNDKFEDDLFNNEDFFTNISFNDTYSSKQAAELLNIKAGKEQIIRNYLNRSDFTAYLNVYKQAKFHRFDWKSLFKFKMILVLNENNFTPMDIASFIGTRVEVSQTEPDNLKNTTQSKNQIEDVATQIINERLTNVLNVLKSNDEYKNEFYSLKFKQQKTNEEYNRTMDKMANLVNRIEDMENYQEFFKATQLNSEQTNSFMSNLFRKKEIQEKKERNIEVEKHLAAFDKKMKDLVTKKKELEQEKLLLLEKKTTNDLAIEKLAKVHGFIEEDNTHEDHTGEENKELNTHDFLT